MLGAECLCPLQIHMLKSYSGAGSLGGLEGGAFMNGITQEFSHSFHHVKTQRELAVHNQRDGSHRNLTMLEHRDL